MTKQRFTELAEDGPFMAFLATVEEDLQSYLEEPRWYQLRKDGIDLGTVAYFSPEFGVGESLPIYSGGLGVLSGDHLKAASDLGIPLVGVGLLYHQGYFRQQLNADGWQQERYPMLDPHGMPLSLLFDEDGHPLKTEVDLGGARCVLQLWKAQVGRIPLILMDSDVEENETDERGVTDRLYGGGTEHRLRQEIVLGIGGVRALQAAGYSADVFHSNEGHAGFMGLERIRQLVVDEGLTFAEALESVRAGTIFTTHTPVPAGIDVYPADLESRRTRHRSAPSPTACIRRRGSVPRSWRCSTATCRRAGSRAEADGGIASKRFPMRSCGGRGKERASDSCTSCASASGDSSRSGVFRGPSWSGRRTSSIPGFSRSVLHAASRSTNEAR
jgi:glucan phosphorylase